MFALSSFQVGKDHALFGEGFVQFDACAAGSQDDLSAVLIANQWGQQAFRHSRQIFKRAFGRQAEGIRREKAQVGTPPGFFAGGRHFGARIGCKSAIAVFG